MTPTQAATPTLPLDPVIFATFQRGTLDALPPRPGASAAETEEQRAGALSFLAALRPRDLMEASLATRIVASHYAAMDCFHRAARDNLPVVLHTRVVGKAVALCRLMDLALRELIRRQGGQEVRPVVKPLGQTAAVRAAGSAPAAEIALAAVPASLAVPEGRHERRRRERAERHLAAAMRRTGGASDATAKAMQERLVAEAAARAAAPAVAAASVAA